MINNGTPEGLDGGFTVDAYIFPPSLRKGGEKTRSESNAQGKNASEDDNLSQTFLNLIFVNLMITNPI
jgi:hypothetical protein